MKILPNKDLNYADFKIILRSYYPGRSMPLHTDDAPRLSIVLFGELEEETLRQRARACAFSVVAKPEAITHRNRFGPRNTRILSVVFQQHENNPMNEDIQLPAWQWFHHWESARESLALVLAIKRKEHEACLKEHIISLLAALQPEAVEQGKEAPLWLRYVAEQVRDHCHEALLVQKLAEAAGVHPVYLARAFRKHYGCSVKEYQHRHRLRRSLGPLTASETALSHLAYDHGYADQAHFSRVFKKETGFSPGQLRETVREIG